MEQRNLSMLIAILLVSSLVSGIVTANPPRPGTEGNGLSENESATLWSRDEDNHNSHAWYGRDAREEWTIPAQVAKGTDITFKRPPATAATWTRNDFDDLEAGGSNTSVHPPHASLEDGQFIQDAHATMFAVQPSTWGHLETDDVSLYVAPNGTVRGLVDYRVRVPHGNSTENRSVEWSLVNHSIDNIWLKQDEEIIARTNGTHTPVLDYEITGNRNITLSIEAEIRVRLKKTIRTDVANGTDVDAVYREVTRNVSDSIGVEIYRLSAYPYYAEYPNGDAGVAVFQSRPWHGYTLTDDGTVRVRGVWRFYTARETNWDMLVRSTRTGSTEVKSDAIPVYVHAYPSRIGPRTEPIRNGPEIIDTWGTERVSPLGTIGENVNIEVVNRPYEMTYGVAVRAENIDREGLHVTGIVRGVNASIVALSNDSERQIRRSNLTVEILQHNQSQVVAQIQLRDNQTSAPIALDESGRQSPIRTTSRTGYITIAGQEVETNASGIAIVTITRPGIYTARYHPGSWLGHNPAYVGDTATFRWHPLGTFDGWFALIIEVGWQLIPFFVLFYAGRFVLRLFGIVDVFHWNS